MRDEVIDDAAPIGPSSGSSATIPALTNGAVAGPRRQPVDACPLPPLPSRSQRSSVEDLANGESATGLTDPLLEARLVVPQRHVGTLRRTRLLRQLRSASDRPVISIVAPPGYGKSSLLVQWATEHSGAVAWLTADDTDSDPVVFLTDLAAAIDRSRTARSGALQRDRGGHGVAPDRCRSIAGSDVPTHGARPDRHRRCTPDHLTGVPRHPRGARRAPARRVAGGDRGTRTDAPPVRSLARRRVHCSRSVRRSWRWTSARPSGWDANSGCGCRPILPRA